MSGIFENRPAWAFLIVAVSFAVTNALLESGDTPAAKKAIGLCFQPRMRCQPNI